jgi:hypothetical protein
MSRYEGLSLG